MNESRLVSARSILAGLLLITCFSDCALPRGYTEHDRAFIVYWRPKDKKRLRLAVKDNIDMKGVVTTAGSEYVAKTSQPASRDAQCLQIARERNVQIVGKTNLSEFAVAPSGLNEYYGTPKNPFNKLWRFIPGGSSSGSAVAAADGPVDVAFGTDTAGSVRVPAACCGIVGLKTTFGLVSLNGVCRLSQSIWIPLVQWPKTSIMSCKGWISCRVGLRHDTEEPLAPNRWPKTSGSGGFTWGAPIQGSTKRLMTLWPELAFEWSHWTKPSRRSGTKPRRMETRWPQPGLGSAIENTSI